WCDQPGGLREGAREDPEAGQLGCGAMTQAARRVFAPATLSMARRGQFLPSH
ncbi:MAG: hypothetical protein H6R02_2275, partial [Burkholderiaceae bacterium]|nr:hypothetical protein [Burkholderiaceae bacterium]